MLWVLLTIPTICAESRDGEIGNQSVDGMLLKILE